MSYEVWGDNDEPSAFDAAIEAGWIDPTDQTRALIDVMNERDRQVNDEGWTFEHDDAHMDSELARAASCYAYPIYAGPQELPTGWPAEWDAQWWNPKDRRCDLIRAAALILAEIERLDRAEKAAS